MIEAKLMALIQGLEDEAAALQKSLLARDTEEIWSALSRQEASVEQIDRFCMEQGSGVKEAVQESPLIRELLKRSQTIVHTNRALTRRFLDVVGQTLASLSRKPAATYSGYGVPVQRSAPVLVCQQG